MESDDERKAFEDYIAITFPENNKRNRSTVIHKPRAENYKIFEREQ